ncbi:MAG: hypothetical protein AB7E55_14235, partial [Pigmentiphaga sp.]
AGDLCRRGARPLGCGASGHVVPVSRGLPCTDTAPSPRQSLRLLAHVLADGAEAFFDAPGWQRPQAPGADDPFWAYGWLH